MVILVFHVVNRGTEEIRQLKIHFSDVLQVEIGSISSHKTMCEQNKGELKIKPVKPKFFKSRPLPYGLRDAVQKEFKKSGKTRILKKVKYSSCSTPVVVVCKINCSVSISGDY